MVEVFVISNFWDVKENTQRSVGDKFKCTKARAIEILNAGNFIEILSAEAEPKVEAIEVVDAVEVKPKAKRKPRAVKPN
jgi:hypothetical protein